MKQTVLMLVLFAGLLYWIFSEYYDHLNAFREDRRVVVTVQEVSCSNRSALRVGRQGVEGSAYVRITRAQCTEIETGQRIELLQARSGDLYWNEEPHKRVFWFIPAYLLMAGYLFLWHDRKRKKQ